MFRSEFVSERTKKLEILDVMKMYSLMVHVKRFQTMYEKKYDRFEN